jgi:hypothetical protein
VGHSGWVSVTTFFNSWVNYGGGTFEDAQFRRDGDSVEVRGVIKSGAIGSVAFNLPPGYRPGKTTGVLTLSANAAHIGVVAANGDVTPSTGTNTDVHMNGIRFVLPVP